MKGRTEEIIKVVEESHLRRQEERHSQMSEAVSHLQEMLAKVDEQEKVLVEFASSLGQLQANIKTP